MNFPKQLTGDDREIWQRQFAGPVISRFSDMELLIQTQVLASKISIVTGWTIPDDATFQQVLYDQFAKKLREDYGSMNTDEIEFAFRKHGTLVQDWGKPFNLHLVDSVLYLYLSRRTELREFVDRLPKEELPKQLPGIQQTEKEFIEESFQMWKGLKNKFYQFINHWLIYDKLLKHGLISMSDEDRVRIKNIVLNDIRDPAGSNFNELRHRLREIQQASTNNQHVNRLCKKYAVAEYFNELIEQGKTQVF